MIFSELVTISIFRRELEALSPDFILKLKDKGWAVVEVKQAEQTAHPHVIAKEQAARELFEKPNSIHYIIKRDDDIRRGSEQLTSFSLFS